MIGTHGLLHWQDPNRYCNQNNNVGEKIGRNAIREVLNDIEKIIPPVFRKTFTKKKTEYLGWWWKEFCSMESIYLSLDAMGIIDEVGWPEWMKIKLNPADFMAGHINDNVNDSIYHSGEVMDNEYIYDLEKMLKKMGFTTRVIKDPDKSVFKNHLPQNHGCVMHIPHHYSPAISWDFDKEQLVWHNVNPGDGRNKNGGKFERMTFGEIEVDYVLVFWRQL
jgi:hypothetical protein